VKIDLKTLRLRGLALITVAGTAWISFSSSQDLAVRAGFGIRAWAFPVCLDAVAAFAVDVWMRRSPAQRSAGTLALTVIGLSLASNVADHYLTAGTILAALLGGIPPAVLAWLLLVLHRHAAPGKAAPVPRGTQDHVEVPAPPPAPQIATWGWPIWTGGPTSTDLADKDDRIGELYRASREDEPQPDLPPTLPISEDSDPVDRVELFSGHRPAPIPRAPEPLERPLPVNVPDNDPERTQLMPRITDEQPGKFDPAAPDDPAPAKVQPARREATEVSAPVEKASRAHLSNEDLIQLAFTEGITSRRAIAAAFGLGTNRAGDIARAVKEKSDG
jgi:hypothetical protein